MSTVCGEDKKKRVIWFYSVITATSPFLFLVIMGATFQNFGNISLLVHLGATNSPMFKFRPPDLPTADRWQHFRKLPVRTYSTGAWLNWGEIGTRRRRKRLQLLLLQAHVLIVCPINWPWKFDLDAQLAGVESQPSATFNDNRNTIQIRNDYMMCVV